MGQGPEAPPPLTERDGRAAGKPRQPPITPVAGGSWSRRSNCWGCFVLATALRRLSSAAKSPGRSAAWGPRSCVSPCERSVAKSCGTLRRCAGACWGHMPRRTLIGDRRRIVAAGATPRPTGSGGEPRGSAKTSATLEATNRQPPAHRASIRADRARRGRSGGRGAASSCAGGGPLRSLAARGRVLLTQGGAEHCSQAPPGHTVGGRGARPWPSTSTRPPSGKHPCRRGGRHAGRAGDGTRASRPRAFWSGR